MSVGFNELTRVQMPAIIHLTRLGYKYFGKIDETMAGTVYDPDTNILIQILSLFNNMGVNSLGTISHNYQENESLKNMKNYLLPLLMNGQVTISD